MLIVQRCVMLEGETDFSEVRVEERRQFFTGIMLKGSNNVLILALVFQHPLGKRIGLNF